jgi:carboxypeptidase Taq
MTPARAYAKLEAQERRASAISGALSVLHWDKAVIMPSGGAEARAAQMAELNLILHGIRTDPARGDMIAEAGKGAEALDDWQRANLTEIDRGFRRATALSADLVAALANGTSNVEMAWRAAREADDFAGIVNPFQDLVGLVREEAACLGEALALDPYDALLDGFEPGLQIEKIETLFSGLKDVLPALLDEVVAAQAALPPLPEIKGPFPIPAQRTLSRKVMTDLGFDFGRGRLDESHHPFSGGVPDDSRITTRYHEGDFFQALMGTIHETGHSMYESGLPEEWRTQPVGRARGMVMHESQSLLFEMQAGRSPEFIGYLSKAVRAAFDRDGPEWRGEPFVRTYHKVERGLIRVYADEVSYPLHVMLRFDLERALLSGDLKVADLPGAWNDGMERLLGIRPETNRDGCLQDIHWYSGAFGYFPTYTLGAFAAAQIFAAAGAAIPGLEGDLSRGSITRLLAWLRTNIHGKASRYSTDEILRQVTGQPLNPGAFLDHVKRRYLNS